MNIFLCAYWPSVFLLQRNVLFQSSAHFWIGLFGFLLSCMSYLYILEIKPWSVPSFADILSLSVSLSFCFVYGFLCYEKACIYKLNLVPFVYFCFCCLDRLTSENIGMIYAKDAKECFACDLFWKFYDIMSLSHFEFIF